MEQHVIMALSFGMGLLAFGLSNVIQRYFLGSRIPKDMARWHSEVESVCYEVIRARIYVAEIERKLVDLVGEVPADFNPVLFSAPALAKAVEDAFVTKAQSQGHDPERRFSSPLPLPDNVHSLDSHEWVAGQLLKKVGS